MMYVIVIGVALVLAVVVVLILASQKPDEFRVARSTLIKAPPEKILGYISDFHKWELWSPFEKYDRAVKKTYTGAASGKGAIFEWEGNSKAGKGRMEVLEPSAPGTVTIKLDFLKPFESKNTAEFKTVPKGDSTELTWEMRGPEPFFTKVMFVFMNMDKMVGKEFDEGLASLKTIAEK